jgi:hypothetical protein
MLKSDASESHNQSIFKKQKFKENENFILFLTFSNQRGSAKEVSFHLNETLGQHVNIKIGGKSIEQKIPLEHKFVTTPLGSQNVYILKQTEENAKGFS